MTSLLETNAFLVLALPVTATRAEIEREGQKWLGMLELGLSEADFYQTPFGQQKRTAELVRNAMAQLRNPEQRLLQELWNQLPSSFVLSSFPARVQTHNALSSSSFFSALGLGPHLSKSEKGTKSSS